MKNINIFISWSGKKSGFVAHQIADWLPSLISHVSTFHSDDHINPGEIWITSLMKQIKAADMSIICLTKESMSSQWLNFETGAIWNSLSSEVYPILIDLDPEDLKGPLGHIQPIRYGMPGMKKLVQKISEKARSDNSSIEEKFEAGWPKFEQGTQFGLESFPAAEFKNDLEKSIEAVNDIIGYLNDNNFTAISFEKLREKFSASYTDEFLDGLIKNYRSVFRKVKLKGQVPGIKKL